MLFVQRLSLGTSLALAALVAVTTLVGEAGADTPSDAAGAAELPELRLVHGRSIAVERWHSPMHGYRLTGRFADGGGYWSSGSHTGLDFATEPGTPVRSVAGGVVVSAAYDGAYGNTTVVRLPDGTEVWYCHQDTQAVAAGERVRGGQVIGTVGVTGNVTGPHLHLEIRPAGGDPVDPEPVLRRHRVRV